MTTSPPPTWTTGSEIPKNARMCVPMKYDPTSKKKLFIAIRRASCLRVLGEYSLVIARKIGLPPSGSTIGNSAVRNRNRLFAASTMTFLQGMLAPSCPGCNDLWLEIIILQPRWRAGKLSPCGVLAGVLKFLAAATGAILARPRARVGVDSKLQPLGVNVVRQRLHPGRKGLQVRNNVSLSIPAELPTVVDHHVLIAGILHSAHARHCPFAIACHSPLGLPLSLAKGHRSLSF